MELHKIKDGVGDDLLGLRGIRAIARGSYGCAVSGAARDLQISAIARDLGLRGFRGVIKVNVKPYLKRE